MLTIGEILRRARLKKNVTLDQVSHSIHLQKKYLEAIERNDWSVFASNVYILGSLRQYADYLDLEPSHAVAYFRRDFEKKEDIRFRRRLPSLSTLSDHKKIMIILVSFISTLFAVFFGYQVYLYLTPPPVEIMSPSRTTFRNVELIRIVGRTQKESVVHIFNQEIFPDKAGVFYFDLPLKKGNNSVKIKVTGPNGKVTELMRQYVLE